MVTSLMLDSTDELHESSLLFDSIEILKDKAIFTTIIPVVMPSQEAYAPLDETINQAFSKIDGRSLEVLELRLGEGLTLADTGEQLGITRERVRQIESTILRKLSALLPSKLFEGLISKFDNTPIVFVEQLPIKNPKLRHLLVGVLSHKNFRRRIIFDSDFQAFVKDKKYIYHNVKNDLTRLLTSLDETICTRETLESHLIHLFPLIDVTTVINKLIEDDDIRIIDGDKYFFHTIYSTKRSKVEFIYTLYPDGFETNKNFLELKEQLTFYFPDVFDNDSKRAITALSSMSDNILLWEWGKHIHKMFIQDILDNYDFTDLQNYIDRELETLLAVDLSGYFHQHEEALTQFGIPSEHALHTLLKLKFPDEYTYQDSPRVSLAGTERLELRKVLLEVMSENRTYSLDELMELLKSPMHRVQQLIDRVDEIISVDTFKYIKRKYIELPNSLLDEIVHYLNDEVKKLHFLYVDLVIDKFRANLNSINQYNSATTLLELLKKYNVEKQFQISNRRIVDKDYTITRNSLNFHFLLEQFMDDRDEISKNELFEYFYIRGLDAKHIMNYYIFSKLKLLARIDDETFMKLSSIGLKEKDIQKVNALVETNSSPELRIIDLIEKIKDNLPHIKINWNRFVLSDILDKELFRVIPSSENPQYIECKNLESKN